MSKLVEFKNDLEMELYRFEFNLFPKTKSGNISCEDFAKSILCYLEASKVKLIFDHLKVHEFEGEITEDQYVSF